ncbi:MAG: trypsin-like peptidase domain-containing protein [Candidatus Saccharibacteria bacterium]|nr:trypsin-like peptidase domain-containing protein [Candidatus Saccharibacteria bacterium]
MEVLKNNQNSKQRFNRFKQINTAASKKMFDRLFLLLLCLSVGFIGGRFGSAESHNSGNSSTSVTKKVVVNESRLINDIAKDVGQSVVSVDVTSKSNTQNIFGQSYGDQKSAGTGFILNEDGVIITNRHVVPVGTNSVSVTLSDGTKLDKVDVIGRTNDSDSLDVAFLKITDKKGKTLVPVKLADSSKVLVGDKVVAIGNALGQFQNTVTAGIISGFGRNLEAGSESGGGTETLQNLFQTDTAINPGNSGGPLVDANGEVIAINTAIAGNAENIGFAIPINDVQGLIKSVLEKGKLIRPFLGVRYISLTDDYAYQLNLPVKRGAYLESQDGVSVVIPGSPAEKAGLRAKDIILSIDKVNIDEKNSLTSILGRRSVGDSIVLNILRDGKEVSLKTVLQAAPEQ